MKVIGRGDLTTANSSSVKLRRPLRLNAIHPPAVRERIPICDFFSILKNLLVTEVMQYKKTMNGVLGICVIYYQYNQDLSLIQGIHGSLQEVLIMHFVCLVAPMSLTRKVFF